MSKTYVSYSYSSSTGCLGSLRYGNYSGITQCINSVRKYPATERNNIVIGAAIFATIGAGLLPAALVNAMPGIVGYLFSAPIAIGCIVVVVMNLIIPAKASDRTEQENELIKLRKERKAQMAKSASE